MANSCPIPTSEQSKASEILDAAKRAMIDKVHKAIAEAAEQVREQILAADLNLDPAPKEYFNAVAHQQMYLAICGANADTLDGGDVKKAIGLIRNQQQIANHYWGAENTVTPKI
jgi:hypothetical protein